MTCAREQTIKIIANRYGEKWAEYFVDNLLFYISRSYFYPASKGEIILWNNKRYRVVRSSQKSGDIKCLETGEVIENFFWCRKGKFVEVERKSCGSIDRSMFKSLFALRSRMLARCPKASREIVNWALRVSLGWFRFLFIVRNEQFSPGMIIERNGQKYRVISNDGYTGEVYSFDDDVIYTSFSWRDKEEVPDIIGVDKESACVH